MASTTPTTGDGLGGDGVDTLPERRGQPRSVALEKVLKKQKTSKLTVDFDEFSGGSLPPNGKMFNNYVAQQTRDAMPHHITHWKQDIFIFPIVTLVRGEIQSLAQSAIKEHIYDFKAHWKEHNGLSDNNAVRRHPYKGVIEEDWSILCEYFGTPKQMKLTEKNVANRSMTKLEGAHGSKTLLDYCHENKDPITGELPSSVDTYEQLVCKKGKWKNDWAESKHNEMKKMRDEQPQLPIDSSLKSVHLPKDIHITTEVLKPRSRYIKGYGPLPKLSLVGGTRVLGISSKNSNEEVTELRQMVAQL